MLPQNGDNDFLKFMGPKSKNKNTNLRTKTKFKNIYNSFNSFTSLNYLIISFNINVS